MPRSNHPRGSRSGSGEDEDFDLSRALYGSLRTETKRGVLWNVQSLSPSSAVKHYTCPGCSQEIALGTGHIVAWRADGLMGEADDIAGRRHWHSHCWRIA